jgi:peptidoglycan/LPS O-acetylase OafA/YrhL
VDIKAYRPDIDGLRALAVTPVLGFHAGIPGFSGGFIGVDIFFVISGYLISRIILRDIAISNFSMVTFAERRIRRILPALYAMMAACLVPAWFLMLPDDFENFGQSLAATALSANNILLYLTSGYWGVTTEFKPLLHTWSLGLEEQFYVGYPLLLVLLSRLRKSWTAWVIALIAAASLIMAQMCLPSMQTAVFLLLPFRMFELLTGAGLAWLEANGGYRLATGCGLSPILVSNAGLLAIAASVILLKESSSVPGVAALIPISGAAALIACGPAVTPVGRLLAWQPLVTIGTISYSLYLWHQPFLAFYRVTCTTPPTPAVLSLVVLTAVPLAWASWKWVETPFRHSKRISRPSVFVLAAVSTTAFVGIGIIIDVKAGFPSRVPGVGTSRDAGGRWVAREMYVDRMYKYMEGDFVDPERLNILVLGNSFARDFLNCAIENDYMTRYEVRYVPVDHPGDLRYLTSETAVSTRMRALLSKSDVVILVQGDLQIFDPGSWETDSRTLCELGAKEIIVVGTKNFGWNPNAIMFMSERTRQSYRPSVEDDVWMRNEVDVRQFPSDVFVNVLGMLADDQRSVPLFTPSGKLISEDGRHLTIHGAKFLGELIFRDSPLTPFR